MAADDRYAHAVRIQRIRDLLENKAFVTVRGLMEEFGVCRKTVYNDRDALIAAGVPLHCDVVDGEARWWLEHEAKRKTITLTLGEGQVLPLGLAQLALSFLEGTEIHDQLREIQKKLAMGASPRTQKQLEEIRRKIAVVRHGPKRYRHQEDVLNDLLTGLLRDERVKIDYRPPGKKTKTHVIEPLTILLYREALYVVAFSQTRKLRIPFAVDRIVRSEWLKGNRFEYPADYDPGEFFDGAFGMMVGGERTPVEIVFDAEQARYVQERSWHPTQKFKTLPDGRVRMTMEVCGTDDVLLWLLGHSGTFEVVAPAAMREAARARLERGLKKHRPRS
jgi:predicted DNA-binding transcriptional regulator YafY